MMKSIHAKLHRPSPALQSCDDATGERIPSFKLAYNIPQLCEATGLGRTSIYEEFKKGALKSVLVGGRRLVLREDAEQWLKGEAQQ